jgi:O-succinylhomoserine sulfhydrylase
MSDKPKTFAHIETAAIRAGENISSEGEHSPAIHATSSYVFDSAAHAAARFSGGEPGNIYSRFTNPTVKAFEDRLAAMEKAAWCTGTASGMAAVNTLIFAVLNSGDHLVASRSLFGTISVLLDTYLPQFDIEVTLVDLVDIDAWKGAVQDNTKMLFLETPSNPTCEIGDIRQLASIARDAGAVLVVDNCFCTPVLQNPIDFGADYVIHSATKYIDGQGRCIGGAICGATAETEEVVRKFIRTTGPSMSPFNAWTFLKGLETLSLRMNAQSDNAQQVTEWLEVHPKISKVNYPGAKGYPQRELAAKQQSRYGAILSFEVSGGRQAAWSVIDATEMLSITANLGDTRSTITHPATTTHGRVAEAEKLRAGITEGLVRLSVGLEHCDDIIEDLARGLDRL